MTPQQWTSIGAFTGAVGMALAFPPAAFAWMAWPATAIWCAICLRTTPMTRRDYGMIYFAGILQWLLIAHWVRLPYWAAYFGWIVLAAYVGTYLPMFVLLTRAVIRRSKIPLVVAAPVVWVGLEAIRARLFTGFAIALLGHSQVAWLELIQVSDIAGAYTVSFIMVIVASAAALTGRASVAGRASARGSKRGRTGGQPPSAPPKPSDWLWAGQASRWGAFGSLLFAGGVLMATLLYGRHCQSVLPVTEFADDTKPVHVALIQGAIDTVFDDQDHTQETFGQYVSLSEQFVAKEGPFDLVVWPESMYAFPWATIAAEETKASGDSQSHRPELFVPKGIESTDDKYREDARRWASATMAQSSLIARAIGTRLLVGAPRVVFSANPPKRLNSAMYLEKDGRVIDAYDKMHPVLFGEYIPFGNWFPALYRLTPMGGGLDAGVSPKTFQVGDVKIAPSICFENTVPHLIRRQCVELTQAGDAPDALITISNDGWFWGSSLLDLHLTCGVFRAVELRRPMLIAANTGFSAWIDRRGQVERRGPRRATGAIHATITPRNAASSLYMWWGDWPVGICALVCAFLLIVCGLDRQPR